MAGKHRNVQKGSKKVQPLPDFRRAALQRFQAAQFLLKSEVYALDAVYLAGNSVECALKAVVVQRTPRKEREALLDHFKGAIAHDFEYLRALLANRKCVIPLEVTEGMRPIVWWSTNLRYQVGRIDYNDAKQALDAAECVLAWMTRSL